MYIYIYNVIMYYSPGGGVVCRWFILDLLSIKYPRELGKIQLNRLHASLNEMNYILLSHMFSSED